MASVCLISVVTGFAYERYCRDLFKSAAEHFTAGDTFRAVKLPGVPGWPTATLHRYRVVLAHAGILTDDYLYLIDADMRLEAEVGDELLAPLVAVQHPGYVAVSREALPYERRLESMACIALEEGGIYYAGGFVGGEREHFLNLALQIDLKIALDEANGLTAIWNDESHLNRQLATKPPSITLDPSFCHPDDDSGYLHIWPRRYERRVVALDKPLRARGDR